MPLFSTTDLKQWIANNKGLFDPPFKTNRVLAHHNEFIVMILAGPNARLDFHREAGEEFFQQIHGDIELHLKPENGPREVVKIREGDIFLCPANLAHSPRRPADTWGLVIERKRRLDELDQFLWFCEHCDEQVLARSVAPAEAATEVRRIYQSFNANLAMRSCKNCGYIFPETPIADRLTFL